MKWAGHNGLRPRQRSKKVAENAEDHSTRMGALCEERSEKGRGERKLERKGQQCGPMEKSTKVTIQWSDN